MSTEVTLTINSKSVTVKAGTTIMDAAQKIGTHVPHFCWHPGLSIAGVCRFCMVKVEGMPKLQIACNTTVAEGMKVDTVDPEVKDAHKWALEFHLINHPLDCPICDQAGECELQNYYMKVGRYDAQMEEKKVLKPKALDVGDTLVLDTERCVLCSRCVRFEDEVTKTGSLGIFNRGDRSVINTFEGRKIQHNYSYNIADICPVGAFTAKDFRFRCRVWFLQETKTICPGCSTGCNVTLFHNKNQRVYYRLKPRFNEEVNGHWMCDYGRTMYEHVNADKRAAVPASEGKTILWADVKSKIDTALFGFQGKADKVSLVFTPQYTNEEYDVVLEQLKSALKGTPSIYIWRDANEDPEAFDGLLFRGDKNPNSKGLMSILEKHGVQAKIIGKDFSALAQQGSQLCFVFGPEVQGAYANLQNDLSKFKELPQVVYFGTSADALSSQFWLRVPTKTYAEKKGTYVNFKGISQKIHPASLVFPQMRGIEELFAGGLK